ncbi:MAG: hypothetical protein M1455_10200 [Actinobacteria bacterium]|nr:hypothetical protein [Actinomycetota bacterium]
MFRAVIHRKKGIIISTLAVAIVVAMDIVVGMAAAQSTAAGTTGTSTTTAGSSTDPSTAVATDPNILSQNDPDCVAYATLVSTEDLSDGGKIYTYSLDGNLVREPTPPAGWNPVTASDDEIKQYGPLYQRPSDPAKLQEWSAKMSLIKFTGKPSQMCKTNKQAGLTNEYNDFPWAGGMTVDGTKDGHTFYWATDKWYQTAFDPSCGYDPTNSGYATWAGLGGANQNRLIQAGTEAAWDSIYGIFPWWEVIDPNHDSNMVKWAEDVISGGDDVEADAYYDASGNVINMAVWDWTKGYNWYVQIYNQYAGDPTYYYWDGSTADFVTESPHGGPAPGGWYYLRKPHLGNTYFYYATANQQPIANFWSWKLYEYSDPSKYWWGTGDYLQGSYFDGIHAWTDPWNNCW